MSEFVLSTGCKPFGDYHVDPGRLFGARAISLRRQTRAAVLTGVAFAVAPSTRSGCPQPSRRPATISRRVADFPRNTNI